MHIVLAGLNHNTAAVEVRERVSFPKERLPDAHALLAEQFGQCVILSTCNRTEVYTVADDPAKAAAEVLRFLTNYHGLETRWLAPHMYDRTDMDTVRHLFRVSSGLDSMILGESQILGQVRNALTAAAESNTLGTAVSGLFHGALRAGRRVRESTGINRNALSVSYAAVQLARRVMGDLDGLRVLLIGAGDAGQLVTKALRHSGIGDLAIANRTERRGQELAHRLGGRSVPFTDLGAALAGADIAIAATEAPGYLLTEREIESAVDWSPKRRLFLFDLSVPRNIEPSAAALENVSLFNIDDLSSVAEENLEERKKAAEQAEVIVEEHVAKFDSWWSSLDAVPLIRGMRQRSELTRERELGKALRMIPDLSPREVDVLDAMTRSIVNRLLHDPTVSLKQRATEDRIDAVRELFRLRPEPC